MVIRKVYKKMMTATDKHNVQMDTGEDQKIVILITADRIGRGDDTLGDKLMVNFIKSLGEMGSALWRIIFVNGGVNLVTHTSPVLMELQNYEKENVTVLSCGTCLEHFGLTSKKAVGDTTNMLDIVTGLQAADKVITIS